MAIERENGALALGFDTGEFLESEILARGAPPGTAVLRVSRRAASDFA